MKGILPIICVVVAGFLFYWYVDPTYTEIRELQKEEATLNLALDRALELQEVRDQLLSRYNTFSQSDLSRVEKLLPDHVDNVRLILDIDGIASEYGMRVRNVALEDPKRRQGSNALGPDTLAYESLVLSFTVSGDYATFRQFLGDIERSLRLVDVEGVSFTALDSGIYDYNVTIRTYWLKP